MSFWGCWKAYRFSASFYVNKERNHDQNIVFDMGKVLVEYEGDRVCRHFSEDEALIRRVSTAVFVSPEWLMLDMGIISEEEGLSQMLARLDTEEEKELARKSFAHWHEYNMYHKEGMEELVRELKEEATASTSVPMHRCAF